jgi:hypothetical protein
MIVQPQNKSKAMAAEFTATVESARGGSEDKLISCRAGRTAENGHMLSHIVIFWTDPANPGAADELVAGARKLLTDIPGITQFHVGKMVGSPRPVVEQSYQVALNLIFPNQETERQYQTHPQHVEYVEKYVKRLVKKIVVYDFE